MFDISFEINDEKYRFSGNAKHLEFFFDTAVRPILNRGREKKEAVKEAVRDAKEWTELFSNPILFSGKDGFFYEWVDKIEPRKAESIPPRKTIKEMVAEELETAKKLRVESKELSEELSDWIGEAKKKNFRKARNKALGLYCDSFPQGITAEMKKSFRIGFNAGWNDRKLSSLATCSMDVGHLMGRFAREENERT